MTEIIDKYYENRKLHADEIFEYFEESMGKDLFKAYLGDKMSQFNIGTELKSIEWMIKSAEQGYSIAQNNLGTWYHNGTNGTVKDYDEAKKWYFKAIEDHEYPTSYSNIGILYRDGLTFDKDIDMAIEYLEKSVELGCAHGNYNLGKIYHDGNQVPTDYEKAFKLFSKAVELDNSDSLYKLSIMYAKGQYVEKDPKKSFEYLLEAVEKGCKLAKDKLEKINNDLF